MQSTLTRALAGAMALCAALASSAATVTSVTIEGPATIDLQNSTSVQYAVIAHWSDATTTDVTQDANWSVTTGNILSVVAGGIVIASGVGTEAISASYFPPGEGFFNATKDVSVVSGAPPAWQAVSLACATENTGGFAPQQLERVFVGSMSDAVPACDAKIVIGNRAVNRLQVVDLRTRSVVGSTPLSGEPGRMRAIPGTTSLLVAVDPSQIARVDLATGAVAYVSVSGSIRDIAPGEPGEAMVLHSPTSSSYFDTWTAVLDLATMSVLADRQMPEDGGLIDYDSVGHRLFLGDKGLSPSSLSRLDYAPAPRTFTLSQYRFDAGSNGLELVLSPDATRLAFADGAGNALDYAIHDLAASDLNSRSGRWNLGLYPIAAGFRPDGQKLIASNDSSLIEFDASRHVIERSWLLHSPGGPSCYFSGHVGPQRAKYSPSARFAYAAYPCDSAGYYSVVNVVALGDPTPPSSPPVIPAADLTFTCTTENKGALPASTPVRLPVEPVRDLVPGCDGRVVLAASESNRLVTLDVRTGAVVGSVPLAASPLGLRRRPGSATVFARLDAMRIAIVDPIAGTSTYADIEGEVAGIVEGEPGQVFVVFREPGSVDPGDRVAVLDAASGARLGTGQLTARGGLLQYDPVARRLIQGNESSSPGTLVRYGYEPTTFAFAELQRSTDLGGAGVDLALSPDRTRAVFVNESGNINALPYRLYDLDAADFASNFGAWDLGPFPASVDFRADGAKLLASNGSELQVFDVASHALDRAWPLPPGGCFPDFVRRIRYSPGARIAFASINCLTFPLPSSMLIVLALESPADVAQNDFNADGRPDIIWSNIASGATYIWRMNGPALLSDSFLATIDPSWKIQGVADFNGDGHPDVVWRNTLNGNCYVWYLVNGVLQSDAFVFGLPPEWVIQGVADFNADGKPDFLMRNTVSGNAFAWFFNDNVAIGDQFLFNIDPSWKVEGVADLNADGQPDLLFRNMASGLAFAWNTQFAAGTLSLSTSSPPIFGIDPVWEVVQVADWNADGKPDLLFRNASTGLVFVWYLDGVALGASDYVTQIDPSWEIVPRR